MSWVGQIMILNIFGFVRTWFKNSKVQKIESGTFGTYGEKGMGVCVAFVS